MSALTRDALAAKRADVERSFAEALRQWELLNAKLNMLRGAALQLDDLLKEVDEPETIPAESNGHDAEATLTPAASDAA